MKDKNNLKGAQRLLQESIVIGIDIDGVLSDTIRATLLEIKRRYGYTMEFDDWRAWSPHEIPELRDIGVQTIQDTIGIFYGILRENGDQKVFPISGSQDGIGNLKSSGKQLLALSGRLESSRNYTVSWLNRYFGNVFQKVLLADYDTPNQIPKYKLARQHGINCMIEDNAHYAIDLSCNGIPTILLENPWNIDIDVSSYPEIYRAKDWNSISSCMGN